MSLLCHDWRSCKAGEIVPLVEAEARAWLEHLHWNVAESWSVIEPARCAGRLPGLVVDDEAGRPAGWTAFLLLDGHLQVMAVAAPDAHAAAALVDGILESPHARDSASTIVCARAGTPGLSSVLGDRGFEIERYRYLSIELHGAGAPTRAFDRWRHHDAQMAQLCARAYGDARGVRAFAPGGTMAEWRGYVASLVQGTGCGWFLPELSFVAAEPGSDRLRAAIMLTELGPGTAHIAQMAVDPRDRGRGLGRAILRAALAEAGALFDRVTLLVAESNVPAVTLYESVGFRDHAEFVVGRLRSSSARRT